MLCRMSSPEQPQPGPRQPQHPRADREGADQGGSAPTSSATSQYGLSPQPQSDQPTPSTPAGQYGHVPATQPAQPGGATEYGRTAPGTQAAAQAATQAEHPDQAGEPATEYGRTPQYGRTAPGTQAGGPHAQSVPTGTAPGLVTSAEPAAASSVPYSPYNPQNAREAARARYGPDAPDTPYNPYSPQSTPAGAAYSPGGPGAPYGTPAPALGASAPAGYPQAAPGTPPAPARRRRTALIITLVVTVLVLVAGTATVTLLLGGKSSTTDNTRWSTAWLNGFEQAWTLEAPGDKPSDTFVHILDDHRFIRLTRKDGTTTATMFRLGQGTPEQLWEETVRSSAFGGSIWKGKLIIGNTVIDLDSHERTTAPWDAKVTTNGNEENGLAVCTDTSCSLWSSLTDKKWESRLPQSGRTTIYTKERVGSYVIAASYEGDDTYYVVNLDNGKIKKLEDNTIDPILQSLEDGWVTYGIDGHVVIYEPDGTVKERFTADNDRRSTVYPWTPNRLTVAQARAWLKDGDTSWAPNTFSASTTDTTCQSITVAGRDINLGKRNPFSEKEVEGCQAGSPVHVFYLSGRGQVSSYYSYGDTTSTLTIIDMTTGASQSLALKSRDDNYTVKDNLMIVYSDSGRLTAYRPR